MKLRITGFLLGILMLAAVIMPVFAAVAGDAYADETHFSGGTANGGAADTVKKNDVFGAARRMDIVMRTVKKFAQNNSNKDIEVEVKSAKRPASDSPFYLNGDQLPDVDYERRNGLVYVTVESFLTAVDHETVVEEWDGSVTAEAVAVTVVAGEEGSGTATTEEENLAFGAKAGNYYVAANDRYLYVADKVQTVGGKVAVPVETLAKVFNLTVEYYDTTGKILLTSREGAGAYIEDGDSYYNEDALYWLSHVIYSESGDHPMTGMIAVGNVVMNRVRSSQFPDTIKGVLFQKNQFSVVASGAIYKTPNKASVIAAKLVMDGAVVLDKALYFNMTGMNTYASRNRTYVATIGSTDFFN